MATLGLIFSGYHAKGDMPFAVHRTIASTPVGGRYRLIDFTLSNLVNNNVNHIGLVTTSNYQSLLDHIGSGKEWDLARKHNGLTILPPYTNKQNTYNTRLESIKNIIDFIRKAPEEYVILTDSYTMCNIDFDNVFKTYFDNKADIVCVYRKHNVKKDDYKPVKNLTINSEGRVTKLDILTKFTGDANLSLDIWVMKKELLVAIAEEAIEKDLHSFNADVLSNRLDKYRVFGYEFKGYYNEVTSLTSFYDLNMDLLLPEVRKELFFVENRPIYTKVRDSAPTKYFDGCKVKNSIIADGCLIEGCVENSVVFRGTVIGKGAVIKNSILMQDTKVEAGSNLDYVITDKNVTIKEGTKISASYDNLKYIKKYEVI